MGKLLCEKNLRDVWCRNESVRAEIGQILHTHTHAAKLVVEIHKRLEATYHQDHGFEVVSQLTLLPSNIVVECNCGDKAVLRRNTTKGRHFGYHHLGCRRLGFNMIINRW